MATLPMNTLTIPELGNTYSYVLVDPSLQCAGDAADARVTGQRLAAIDAQLLCRVASLTETPLAVGTAVECVGIPAYISDLTTEQAVAYGLTDTGWYVFARITAPTGVTVGETTTVTGAKAIITTGAGYVNVAVRFEVAAASQAVTVTWAASSEETYVFKATDLAVRNLDYRTTFYVYDLAPFVTWEYALTTDETFVAAKNYYTLSGGEYTLAPESVKYALTEDATFAEGKTYYTEADGVYTAATVTAGEAVTADTYYELTAVPADTYYNHSKITISGAARNVTYRLDQIVDCPMEFILPAIEDETHGCWFEMRFRHAGEYSMTLTPPSSDVKIATEHTQKETAGINMIDLHYTVIDGIKIWRFLNTHSSIPT